MFKRFSFILKYRTFKKIVALNDNKVVALSQFGPVEAPARCPHQGAPLQNASIENNGIVCHWHGCRYDLLKKRWLSPKECKLK